MIDFKKKRILIVIPPIDYDENDFEIVRRAFVNAGHKVTVASKHLGAIRGSEGNTFRPDVTLNELKHYDYDATIFVDGPGARVLFDDDRTVKLVKEAGWKPTGCIGGTTYLLAKAELLNYKKVTGDPAMAKRILEPCIGTTFTNHPVEVDEKFFTCQSGTPVYLLVRAMMDYLAKN